jgi:hypothetical protein
MSTLNRVILTYVWDKVIGAKTKANDKAFHGVKCEELAPGSQEGNGLKGHLPVVLRLALEVLNARRSAVPAGLMQRRTCVPNVETLGYWRRVPPGQVRII